MNARQGTVAARGSLSRAPLTMGGGRMHDAVVGTLRWLLGMDIIGRLCCGSE